MKKLNLIFIIAITLFTSSCITLTPGFNLYNSDKATNKKNDKMVEKCIPAILGFIPFGDLSVYKLAKKNNIKNVSAVDYSYTYYVLWADTCVNVYGS